MSSTPLSSPPTDIGSALPPPKASRFGIWNPNAWLMKSSWMFHQLERMLLSHTALASPGLLMELIFSLVTLIT